VTTLKERYWGLLAYNGTRYKGFQRLSGGLPSVQGALEKALREVLQVKTTTRGAGRTDAGVHATGQVVGFDAEWKHGTDALQRAINANLPRDIVMQAVGGAPEGFHPRYDAVSRTYIYQFYTAPIRNPVLDVTRWWVGDTLDFDVMQDAANMLIGSHDFATFGKPTIGTVTIRDLHFARFKRGDDGLHEFHIQANGFLQRMVRSIMGTLVVKVGRGAMSLAEFEAAFRAAQRSQAGPSAPPQGLILVHVGYNNLQIGDSNESQNLDTETR